MTSSRAVNWFTEWIEDSADGTPAWVFADLDQELPRLRQIIHAAGIDTREPLDLWVMLATISVICPMVINHAVSASAGDPEDVAEHTTAAFRQVGVLIRELTQPEGLWPTGHTKRGIS